MRTRRRRGPGGWFGSWFGLWLVLAVAVPAALAGEAELQRFRLVDPLDRTLAIDYVAIVPERLAPALAPLLAYRSEHGLAVGYVTVEQIAGERTGRARAEALRDWIARARRRYRRAPRFVLLAGDTDTIPAFVEAEIPTDHPYACPEGGDRIELAVGRLPARTRVVLARMVRKTLAAEQRPGGVWQKQLSFFAGVGGFKFDRALEWITSRLLSRRIPPAYDIDMTYASPRSPWFYPPARFARHLRERIEQGPLVLTFIGHGSPSGTQDVVFRGQRYPILDVATAREIEGGQTTGMVALACSTGAYAGRTPSIGEVLLARPGGVAWFYGASTPSAPYGNAALGDALIGRALAAGGPETVGEAIAQAEQALLDSIAKRLVGALVARFTGVSTSGDEIREHVLMYNLLGDPALRLRRPGRCGGLRLEAEPLAAGDTLPAGWRVRGAGAAPGARLTVTIERDRPEIGERLEPIDPSRPDWEEAVLRNHRRANDPVLARAEVRADEAGRWSVQLRFPRASEARFVKAWYEGEGGLCATGRRMWRVGASRGGEQRRGR